MFDTFFSLFFSSHKESRDERNEEKDVWNIDTQFLCVWMERDHTAHYFRGVQVIVHKQVNNHISITHFTHQGSNLKLF